MAARSVEREGCGASSFDPVLVETNGNSPTGISAERYSCGDVECSGSESLADDLIQRPSEALLLDPGRVQSLVAVASLEAGRGTDEVEQMAASSVKSEGYDTSFLDPGRVHSDEHSASGNADTRCSCGDMECSVPSLPSPWIHRLVVRLYIRTRARTELSLGKRGCPVLM